MQYLLLVYTDTAMLDALPEGRFDTMMRECLGHADEMVSEGTLLGFQQLEDAATAKRELMYTEPDLRTGLFYSFYCSG